jgi:hypothetical protein
MIGANDLWTVPEPVPGEPAGASSYRLWRISRVCRLVSLLWRAVWEPSAADRTAPDAPFVPSPLGGESPGWSYALQRNLEDMAARIRRAHAEPILLTYPPDKAAYGDANPEIRSTAASAGIRSIDLTRRSVTGAPDGRVASSFPTSIPLPRGMHSWRGPSLPASHHARLRLREVSGLLLSVPAASLTSKYNGHTS